MRCVSLSEQNCSCARLRLQFSCDFSTSSRAHTHTHVCCFINNRHIRIEATDTTIADLNVEREREREIGYLNYDLRLVICTSLSGHFGHKSVVEHPYAANSGVPFVVANLLARRSSVLRVLRCTDTLSVNNFSFVRLGNISKQLEH